MKYKTHSNNTIPFFILLFFTGIAFSFSQTKIITGTVSDSLDIPLENANIIAKPLQEQAALKFCIADSKGNYRLEIDNRIKYEITVSYIGYKEESVIFESQNVPDSYNFKLKHSGQNLKEITIRQDHVPVIIKKDTLTYNVRSFANGTERKLKEILKKLPGVEVDKKGIIFVQGKKVTKMLIEGKSFFGGGSKLAVENIPADALDKIEVIDNFNEVGFMKEVSDSDELAMNVKLKADKKQFLFGDIEAGHGNDNYYRTHTALFYYSPKTNMSFIGDLNNIGKSTFTFEDMLRFDGGISSLLSGRKSLTNLYTFTDDNNDVLENKSQFAAYNFNQDLTSKITIKGYGLFSGSTKAAQMHSFNHYFQNNTSTTEDKIQIDKNQSGLAIGNIKLDYAPNKKEKWFYNFQYQATANDLSADIYSATNSDQRNFNTKSKADNNYIRQYLEGHKKFNSHHAATVLINHTYDKNTPQNEWFSNQKFLTGLIPIHEDYLYNIEQIKQTQNNTLDLLLKEYWVINPANHLYASIGNNLSRTIVKTSEKQHLTNGFVNNFNNAGYGNDLTYNLNDAYIGIEYKFKIRNWTNKPAIFLHWYQMSTAQVMTNRINRTLFAPEWNSEYEFNKSEYINFTYKLSNDFPEAEQLANQYTLRYYNTVYKGNALLGNERQHLFSLRYTKMNMYRAIDWNANINFNKKVKTIRDEVAIDGINQFNTPILTNNPETNCRFYGYFAKKNRYISLRFNTSFNWLNYTQNINNTITSNNRNEQNLGVTIRTVKKNWPDLSVTYTKSYSQFSGITKSNYQSDALTADFEITVLKNWIYKTDYAALRNTTKGQHNFYGIANARLRYQKPNSPFGFECTANNIFNNKVKNEYSFSDYSISTSSFYVIPRVLMIAASYKL